MSVTDKVVHAKKGAFIEAFATLGNLSATSRLTQIRRTSHYEWLKTDEQYAADFAEAQIRAIDALESEARRRAVDGVDEPVFNRGEVVGHIRRYSDTLLIFLLKGARPDKYRERVDVTLNVRETAARMATELGMSVEDVIAEAERIVAGGV